MTAEKTSQAEHIADLEKTVAELRASRSAESRASSPDVPLAGAEVRDLNRSLDRKKEEVRDKEREIADKDRELERVRDELRRVSRSVEDELAKVQSQLRNAEDKARDAERERNLAQDELKRNSVEQARRRDTEDREGGGRSPYASPTS